MQSWFGRGKKNSIRIIFQSFVASEDPDQLIDLVVIRFYVFVTNWPVVSQSVYTFPFEISWSEPKRDPSPVIGTSAHHSGAPPIPLGIVFMSIRFSIDIPATVAGIKITE